MVPKENAELLSLGGKKLLCSLGMHHSKCNFQVEGPSNFLKMGKAFK